MFEDITIRDLTESAAYLFCSDEDYIDEMAAFGILPTYTGSLYEDAQEWSQP